MLKIKVNDKLIKITDEKLTKSKINSIKIIIDKYGITEILDFNLTIKETLFELIENTTDVSLMEPLTINNFIQLLTELVSNIEEKSDDLENVNISFEGLFII
jgi:Asp-tRNA(Asn)/Glu-tRNA(Gln) amidotransferase B subunit